MNSPAAYFARRLRHSVSQGLCSVPSSTAGNLKKLHLISGNLFDNRRHATHNDASTCYAAAFTQLKAHAMKSHGLSKSRIIAWKQCPKRLWLQVHMPELLEVSDGAEQGFQIGYEVGDVAQGMFPTGILIKDDDDLSAALATTKETMAAYPDRPIFEATFQHDGVLVRADLMLPTETGYRMTEIKASTSVKPYHLNDCAIQAWVIKKNGVRLTSIELAHIDTSFIYRGDGDYHGIFRHEKLDDVIGPLLTIVPEWIKESRRTLFGDEPTIEMGMQCDDPFECPFKAY